MNRQLGEHLRPAGPVQAVHFFYPICQATFFGPAAPSCLLKLRAASAAGVCTFRLGNTSPCPMPFIQINPCDLDRPVAEILAHLLHAMVHHYAWLGGESLEHGPAFLRLARQTGIPASPGPWCAIGAVQPPFTTLLDLYSIAWEALHDDESMVHPNSGPGRRLD
jgi:hypothetical protein